MILKLPARSKYVLTEKVRIATSIRGIYIKYNLFNIKLLDQGTLILGEGFHWDGASGPAIDTRNFLIPSAVHDALYILMRDGLLEKSYRTMADDLLVKMCLDGGMSKLRAAYIGFAVKHFGAAALEKGMEGVC